MKPIELARECAASLRPHSHNSFLILEGSRDGTDVVRAALAMHVRLSDSECMEIARLRQALSDIATADQHKRMSDAITLLYTHGIITEKMRAHARGQL